MAVQLRQDNVKGGRGGNLKQAVHSVKGNRVVRAALQEVERLLEAGSINGIRSRLFALDTCQQVEIFCGEVNGILGQKSAVSCSLLKGNVPQGLFRVHAAEGLGSADRDLHRPLVDHQQARVGPG